ncbi:MAG: hypothetical protein KF744_07480 [Taibaiella sp.]|nr:hypothetical protein [Taibaiella sp.]
MIRYVCMAALVLLFTALGSACKRDRQPCLTPRIATVKTRMVRVGADNKVVDSPLRAAIFLPDSDVDSVARLYAKSSTFTLTLSQLADTCRWYIAADSAVGSAIDTVDFRYSRKLNFISNACGYNYLFTLLSVTSTHNFIDSIKTEDANVSNDASKNNIQVFIHPAP